MDFKSHLPKRITQFLLGLFITLTVLFTIIPPLVTYAGGVDGYGQQVAQSAVASYNGTSDNNCGGNSNIKNGVLSTRTGYLCYMLTKDGGTTGLPAYAFSSPGLNEIAGSRWVCTSRRGQSVSSWYAPAPWGVTPWDGTSQSSNEPQIREWMLQLIDGAPQAIIFWRERICTIHLFTVK